LVVVTTAHNPQAGSAAEADNHARPLLTGQGRGSSRVRRRNTQEDTMNILNSIFKIQSKLPDELKAKTIEDMEAGEEGYTYPWAVSVDEQDYLWIDGGYPVHDTEGGACHLQISRFGHAIIVNRRSFGDFRFSKRTPPRETLIEQGYFPVILRY
jgi:hypothetical protein